MGKTTRRGHRQKDQSLYDPWNGAISGENNVEEMEIKDAENPPDFPL
jgi:hypothetical protein